MERSLLQSCSGRSVRWTPILQRQTSSKKEILETIFENYLCPSVSPDCSRIALLEDKKFILLKVDENGHDVDAVSEVLLEDDDTLRATRRFAWSQDSKMFIFTSTDTYGAVRLIAFNRNGRCILTPAPLENFMPFSAITIADIVFQNFGHNWN